ncbi:MAG: methyltransferase domain-containing protein [Rhodothermales bacterium]|nr:methyltransferase domain-containing protein [Rhodothermales bacterium]MBO6778014.1 methyltransferase domain-containing protein [Rhodothermales bacterium]
MTQDTRESHWNRIFDETESTRLGWFEEDTSPTWAMLDQIGDLGDATVLLPGAGTSQLAQEMESRGARLILNDISGSALDRLRNVLLGTHRWLNQDIAQPLPDDIVDVDLWADRAVLHFLTEQAAIKAYFDNVRRVVRSGGHVLLAEFARDGATRCAGLPVYRWDVDEMGSRFGPTFRLVDYRHHTYYNPNGDPRPYVYGLFQRAT